MPQHEVPYQQIFSLLKFYVHFIRGSLIIYDHLDDLLLWWVSQEIRHTLTWWCFHCKTDDIWGWIYECNWSNNCWTRSSEGQISCSQRLTAQGLINLMLLLLLHGGEQGLRFSLSTGKEMIWEMEYMILFFFFCLLS